MTEFELIDLIRAKLPLNSSVVVGAGDDCAVVRGGSGGRLLLLKTDAVVEGVHFEPGTDPYRVGRKALGRCLSDVAAMGGKPMHALVTLGLPPGRDSAWVLRLYDGLREMAERHGVGIVGGETTSHPGGAFVSVALTGEAEEGRCALRSGAKPGDALFVSGELGGSMDSGRHLDFEPRLAEGQWLVRSFDVHAMIDLSDGLAGDLRHVLRASGVGAELLARAIPVHRAARVGGERGGSLGRPGLKRALSDGEDFELLFAVAPKDATRVLDGWREQFAGVRLSCVGRVTAEPGLRIRSARGIEDLGAAGFDHFRDGEGSGA